jgi:hypothetical protein
LENLIEKNKFENPKLKLKQKIISRKVVRMWTGLKWLKMGPNNCYLFGDV